MYALKEKVAGKISGFFTDSRISASSDSSPSDRFKARPYSKEEKPFSSLYDLIPSIGLGGTISNDKQNDLNAGKSIPLKWNGTEFELQDEYFGCYEDSTAYSKNENLRKLSEDDQKKSSLSNVKTKVSVNDNDGNHATGSSTDSDEYEEATDKESPGKPLNNLTSDSAFITSNLHEFLASSLPNIVKGCQWVLLYSTLKHGISLRTLIRKSADLTGPCLLIAGDRKGAIFGGLLECPLRPSSKRKYQGTNQTFVFTTIYGEPRLFRPTGANRYYFMCMNDFLAFGGGGKYALWLDSDLLNGTSGPCETFGNMCLAHNEDFDLKNVELWGFSHVSRYLT